MFLNIVLSHVLINHMLNFVHKCKTNSEHYIYEGYATKRNVFICMIDYESNSRFKTLVANDF